MSLESFIGTEVYLTLKVVGYSKPNGIFRGVIEGLGICVEFSNGKYSIFPTDLIERFDFENVTGL